MARNYILGLAKGKHMTDIDRSQFYSGGFFLIRAGHPGWKELDAELIPPKIVSLSDCMNTKFNIIWTWTTGDKEVALEIGIPESKWDELKIWCTDKFQKQIDLGGVFTSKQVAQQFIKQFIPDTTDLYLIEVGLPIYIEQQFWQDEPSELQTDACIESIIAKHLPVSEDGVILGFDVIGMEYSNLSHSWFCTYIHRDMFELYGIKSNALGLLDEYEDAKKVYEWIEQDENKRARAELVPYDFWLVVSHALEDETENPPTEK